MVTRRELTIPLHRQIFTADLDEVEALPRSKVMTHLETIDRDVCTKYLEHVIGGLGEQGVEFHEKLVDLYLETLTSQRSSTFRPGFDSHRTAAID